MKENVLGNMVLLLLGKTVSLLGGSVYTFAMGLYVLKLTGSGLTFSVTLVLGILPVVLINPLAGVIADRGNRKHLVIAADLLNAGLLFGLLLYTRFAGLGIAAVYASTLLLNTITVLFDISLESSIPDIVPGENLMGLNSASKAIEAAASVLGPMLGGLVYLLADIRTFIAFNAASFLFSALMESFVDFELGRKKRDGKEAEGDLPQEGCRSSNSGPSGSVISRIWVDIREGVAYARGNGEITGAFLFLAGLNFLLGFSILVPLPYLLNNVLLLGPANYGIIQAAFPVGALLGAFLIKRWNPGSGYGGILFKAALAMALSLLFVAVPVLWKDAGVAKQLQTAWYGMIMVVLGVSTASIDIPLLFLLQTGLPGYIRARVLSIGMSFVKAASPLAFILSGIMLDVLPVFLLPLAGGFLLSIYALAYRKRTGSGRTDKGSDEGSNGESDGRSGEGNGGETGVGTETEIGVALSR